MEELLGMDIWNMTKIIAPYVGALILIGGRVLPFISGFHKQRIIHDVNRNYERIVGAGYDLRHSLIDKKEYDRRIFIPRIKILVHGLLYEGEIWASLNRYGLAQDRKKLN